MECQECNENVATLHFAKVINGEKTEIHVCEKCAKEKGYVNNEEEAYSLHDLLSGLFNFDSASYPNQAAMDTYRKKQLKCEKCGMTYQDFTRIGKFGCASCYDTFSKHLNPIFRRVHSGNTKHDGKVPKRTSSALYQKKKVDQLKEKLKAHIEKEEFEEAAMVRDKIKAIEKSHNQEGEGE